jgi:putative transposase
MRSNSTPKKKRLPVQTSLEFRTHGGARQGAGRKRVNKDSVIHHARAKFTRPTAVHVTLKMTKAVFNLRSRRSFTVIARSLFKSAGRFGSSVVEFAVQGDHIHLLLQTASSQMLTKAVQGLEVRIARGLNRMMKRSGKVFADRYFVVILKTPTQVRNARHYVRNNFRRHLAEFRPDVTLPSTFVDPYSSQSPLVAGWLPAPTIWIFSKEAEQRVNDAQRRRNNERR